jgi:chromosome segregation ATPase
MGKQLELQQQLISSEEERLKVAQALVDAQIEHATAMEAAETAKFELTNRLISYENALLDLETKAASRDAAIEGLQKKLEEAKEESRELKVEYVALRNNFTLVSGDLKKEKDRNEEISVQLINVVNSRNAIQKEKEQWLLERDSNFRSLQEMEERLNARERERGELELSMTGIRAQMELAQAEVTCCWRWLTAKRLCGCKGSNSSGRICTRRRN